MGHVARQHGRGLARPAPRRKNDANTLRWSVRSDGESGFVFVNNYERRRDVANHTCTARPEYYGMLAFAMAGKGGLLKLALDKGEINLTAYATKGDQGLLWGTGVNKDLSPMPDWKLRCRAAIRRRKLSGFARRRWRAKVR